MDKGVFQMMVWLMGHMSLLMSCALLLSESVAAVVQLLFPENKGVSGMLAGVIKFLQSLGAKDPVK